jgi:hypothetical protein
MDVIYIKGILVLTHVGHQAYIASEVMCDGAYINFFQVQRPKIQLITLESTSTRYIASQLIIIIIINNNNTNNNSNNERTCEKVPHCRSPPRGGGWWLGFGGKDRGCRRREEEGEG